MSNFWSCSILDFDLDLRLHCWISFRLLDQVLKSHDCGGSWWKEFQYELDTNSCFLCGDCTSFMTRILIRFILNPWEIIKGRNNTSGSLAGDIPKRHLVIDLWLTVDWIPYFILPFFVPSTEVGWNLAVGSLRTKAIFASANQTHGTHYLWSCCFFSFDRRFHTALSWYQFIYCWSSCIHDCGWIQGGLGFGWLGPTHSTVHRSATIPLRFSSVVQSDFLPSLPLLCVSTEFGIITGI